MTRPFARKFQALGFVALFVGIVTVLATVALMAQVPDAKASTASTPLPAFISYQRSPVNPENRPMKKFALGPLDSGAPLFLPPVTYSSGGDNPLTVAVADVNNDGIPDLVIANQCTGPDYCDFPGLVSVLLGNGDGTFQPAVTYASGGSVLNSIAVADLNGDGKPDIVAVNNCSTSDFNDCPVASIGVLLGNGDGTFQPVFTYPSAMSSQAIAVADVNGDGKPDLLVVNLCASGCDNQGSVAVFLGNGDGTFRTAVSYPSGGYISKSIAVADLNGDGRLDVVVSSFCGDNNVNVDFCDNPAPVGVLLGNGDGTFQPAVLYGTGGQDALAVAVGDVNGDGRPDLLVANCGSGGCGTFWPPPPGGVVGVLLGRGDGTFQPATVYGSGSYYSIAVADVDADGKLDIVAANWACASNNTGCVTVMLGNGDGTFRNSIAYDSSGNFPNTIAVADLNGDGRFDVVATHGLGNGRNLPPGSVDVLLNNSTGSLNPTMTTLTSSLNPSNYGQSVTFRAAVGSSSGAPMGTVIFYDGSIALGSATLTNGSASLSTSLLSAGSHSITAVYQGSGAFDPSTSAPLNQAVNGKANFSTKTKLTTSDSPSLVGKPVTFTATVTSTGGAIPNGELVTFSDSGTTIGTGATASGVATLTTSSLTAKTHTIKATYPGDGTFKSSSGTVTQVVNKYSTTTTLVSSLNPAIYGQPITYTATVTPTGPNTPTGNVRITNIGLLPLVNGVAKITKPKVMVGTHAITAEYLGDSVSAPSTSPVLDEVVNQAPTTTVLTSSANPSKSGQTVTFSATVTSSTGLPPYGTVTFTAGTATLGTITLNNTKASVSTSPLPTGSTTITATYSGSPGFIGSLASLTQKVQP